jgi:magnesium-transporting ATPase (P-type)
MITGDKLETAENIALSCGITNLDMCLVVLRDLTEVNICSLK